MATASGVSVLVVELAEHPRDGGRLGGNLNPLHRSAAQLASADVDLPHVTQEPRPGTALGGALLHQECATASMRETGDYQL